MAFIKYETLAFVIFIIILGFVKCEDWNYNVERGNCNREDNVLLFEKREDHRYEFLSQIEKTVNYWGDRKITCVIVKNLWDDGTGGNALIRRGGIGQKFVTIDLVSQFGRGLAFLIQVYG